MPAIGITGGISTGKSTFCDCLREIIPAAKFFDADLAARSLAELPEVKQEILGQFGRRGLFARWGLESNETSGDSICGRDQETRARTNSSPSDSSPVDGGGEKAS